MLTSYITAVMLASDVSAESTSTLVVACFATWCLSMIQLSAHVIIKTYYPMMIRQ